MKTIVLHQTASASRSHRNTFARGANMSPYWSKDVEGRLTYRGGRQGQEVPPKSGTE